MKADNTGEEYPLKPVQNKTVKSATMHDVARLAGVSIATVSAVINEKGGNATISQYIIRWLLRVSDFMMVIILFLMIFFGSLYNQALFLALVAIADVFCVALTKKSQRLGDMAAGTILISTKNKSSLDETVFMETAVNYVPVYPEVMRLSDRDLNIIKSVYNTVLKKNDYALAERTAGKIETALKIHNKQHPLEFL